MRLRAEQLQSTLKSKGLASIYIISGDEPLQLMEAADEIRQFARQLGYDERLVLDTSTGFQWDELLQENASLSLFSSRRIIELKLGNSKPGIEGGKVLVNFSEQTFADNVLIITSAKIDKKTQQSKWYKALEKTGIAIQVWPIEIMQLPDWIKQRARKKNKHISQPAATLIAERIEGNMLAASQEIDKLCLLFEKNDIEIDDVLSVVTDSTRFDVFKLIEAALTGNVKRVVHMLRGLQGEGVDPAAVYGAMLWEYRRLCSIGFHAEAGKPIEKLFTEFHIWDNKRKHAIKAVLQRHKAEDLQALLRTAVYIDRELKGPDKPMVWDTLQGFLLAIAGYPVNQTNLKYVC